MLYQPTNMFPSIFGAKGNGVIDASIQNEFTATIGGGGSIRAYRLRIFDNATSLQQDGDDSPREFTPVYDSGIVILKKQVMQNGQLVDVVDPFYTTDYTGKQLVFKVTVPSTNNGMRNEHKDGYKWILSVWEKLNNDESEPDESGPKSESVEQFFWTAITPSWSWADSSFKQVINTRSHIWKINYSSTIEPERFKWMLYSIDGNTKTLIDETPWIYDSSQIWYKNDGLISGINQDARRYNIRAIIVNRLGIITDTDQYGMNIFEVEYDKLSIDGATNIYQQDSGIRVEWGGIQRIEGVAVLKEDESEDGTCELDEENGICDVADNSLLKFTSSNTFNVECNYDSDIALIALVKPYNTEDKDIFSFTSDDDTYIRILRHVGFISGLTPSSTSIAAPSNTLVPSDGNPGNWIYIIKKYNNDTESFDQQITSIESDVITTYNFFSVIMRGDGSLEVVKV